MPKRVVASLVGVVISCLPFPVEGPRVLVAAGMTSPLCTPDACEIELTKHVTLTDSEGRLPTSAVVLARDSRGRVYVSTRTKTSVLVFDATGNVSSVIGNSAASSSAQNSESRFGYFGMVTRLLVGADDTVFIGQLLGPSTMVLSRDLHLLPPIKSTYIPTIILGDGTFLVARQIQTPDLVGFPLHVMDRQGHIVRSFGADVPQYRDDEKLQFERVAGVGRAGTIWVAAPGRYEFERWDPIRGTRLQTLPVKSSWFMPSSRMARLSERPNSLVLSLWEKDGVLWVLSRTADALWKPSEHRAGDRPHDDAEYDRTLDWVLEAIDPASAAVIAHRRFGTAMWPAPPAYVVTTTSTAGAARGLVVSSAVLRAKEK